MTDNIVCISHRKDVDGLASAALIRRVADAEVLLADYEDMITKIGQVKDVKQFYICDLGLSRATIKPFIREMERIGRSASITYIDHHPLSRYIKERLQALNIDLIHSTRECTSILVYLKFKDSLSRNAGVLACYGAITDYMDDSSESTSLVHSFDRQLMLFEATLLSMAVGRAAKKPRVLERFVEELSDLVYPHKIQGVMTLAFDQINLLAELSKIVGSIGVKLNSLAYAPDQGDSSGHLANLLTGFFEVPVGLVVKKGVDDRFREVSIRSIPKLDRHLGKLVARLAHKVGGYGGGHKRAAGARIPKEKVEIFIESLDNELRSL